jgi:hypothetical protein
MEHINYPLQEKIQAFVNGDMDQSVRKSFLYETAGDKEAQEELAFSKSLSRALQNREMLAAAVIISQVVAEEGFPPPSAPASTASGTSKWVVGLGAAVLLTIASWVGYEWADRAGFFLTTAQELAVSTLSPLENVLYLPTQGAGLEALQMGMAAYDAGKYESAAQSLTTYLNTRAEPSVQVYLGVSLLLTDRPSEAVRPLADASLSPEPPVQEAACWYLSLAYLAQDKPDAARQSLNRIPTDGIFGAKAAALLQQLPK